tara:strand:+ start:76 stop:876 length:801 start_codon:yes stop_codon:yes gene_type:complete
MKAFLGLALVALIAYLLEWNWVALILLLAAIGNLIPDKKQKKKAKNTKALIAKNTEQASDKRTKLKAAVKLKKTDLPGAISLLREAYLDGEAISLDEFLRLPNYLRLNKQYDAAFQECRKLAHYGYFESYEQNTWGWYLEQCKIQKLQSRICMDQGKYSDALAQNVLNYFYAIKSAELLSRSSHHSSLIESAKSDLQFLKSDPDYPAYLVLGGVLKKLGLADKKEPATKIISEWARGWPDEPETLQHSLEELLFETHLEKTKPPKP